MLAMGIVFQVGLQTALNIGVVTDTLPNTGISLPFFSYGGTSLMMLLVEMGNTLLSGIKVFANRKIKSLRIRSKHMKVIFAAGGTGGHINPALASAGELRRRHPDVDILFIGTKEHMESKLVPAAGFAFKTIEITGFQRKFSAKKYS